MTEIQYLVVAGLLKKDNKVLVVYKHTSSSDKCRNRWELPGGRAGFGLSFENAVCEKMKDYLGVEVKVIGIIPKIASITSHESNSTKHCWVLCAQCELVSEDIRINTSKLSKYKWVSQDEAECMFRDELLVDGDIDFIRNALK